MEEDDANIIANRKRPKIHGLDSVLLEFRCIQTFFYKNIYYFAENELNENIFHF